MAWIFFPNTMWLGLVVWVAPAMVRLGTIVLVSARVRGFQEPYQLGIPSSCLSPCW